MIRSGSPSGEGIQNSAELMVSKLQEAGAETRRSWTRQGNGWQDFCITDESQSENSQSKNYFPKITKLSITLTTVETETYSGVSEAFVDFCCLDDEEQVVRQVREKTRGHAQQCNNTTETDTQRKRETRKH